MATKKLFSDEQVEELLANPFTLACTNEQIRFTVEFKKCLLNEHQKTDARWQDIFKKLGYDPEVLGKSRIYSIVHEARAQAASEKGLHETTTVKKFKKSNRKKADAKAIQELQKEVIRLQQQIEFLKKIQMIKMQDETEK